MPPLPPLVLGPLSVCSARVRVQGQVTGSTVTLFADGRMVGQAAATGPDQWFDLAPGVPLPPRAKVTATQEDGGGVSAPSPQPVIVQARPQHPGHVVIVSHLWQGGECIFVTGATPGAAVTLTGHGGTFRASADDGTATVHRKPLQAHELMEAFQTPCGVAGPRTIGAPAEPLPSGYTTPYFDEPLHACQTELVVHGVADGGTITLTRSAGDTQAGCVPVSDGIVGLITPLQENETVSCRLELPRGQVVAPPRSGRVGPRPPEPAVRGHLCAGSTSIVVTGLVTGQRLTVLQNGQSIGYCEAPSATFAVPTPPLVAGSTITLQYGLCDAVSTTARSCTVDAAPASLAAPLLAPCVACAESVHVSKVHPGASVQVISEQLGAPIGQAYADGEAVDISVAPLLIAGDRLTAVQTGCGHTSKPSPAVVVAALGTLAPPVVVTPLLEGRHAVTVANLRPGARVDVYVNDLFAGAALATASTVSVPVQQGGLPLLIGQKVYARERLCTETATSTGVAVAPLPPVIHFSAVPAGGITRGETATLVWRVDNADRVQIDPGAITGGADGSHLVTPQQPTTYTLTAWHREVTRTAQVRIDVAEPIGQPPPSQTITLQPVAPGLGGGNEGWEGQVTLVNHTGVLTAIENPHPAITLRLVKNGKTFSDCNDSMAVVVLGPGARTQPMDLATLYGAQTPSLVSGVPFAIRACAGPPDNVIGPTGIPIAITVNAYLTVT
jgi:hypothetical protein